GMSELVGELHVVGRRLSSLEPAEAVVAHDPEQPGPCVVAAQRAKVAIGTQAGFLHDVLRRMLVAHQPAGEIERRVEVRQHQSFETARLCHDRHYAWTTSKPFICSWPSPQKLSHRKA